MSLKEAIRNGQSKLSIIYSVQFRIFLIICITGIFSCLFMRFGIMRSYQNRAVEVRTQDVQNQLVILADHLITYNYLQDSSSEIINAELKQLSDLYDGRVLVIDSNFRIIKDTYNTKMGRIIVSEDVIKCFRGQSVSGYDDENQYIEMTVPIVSKAEDRNDTIGVILASVSTESISANTDILNRNAVIISIIVLCFIFAAAIGISRILIRPFERVTKAITEVKAGYSDEKIEVNDYLETKHIVDAFNQLQTRMKALNDSREEFVANVSHELKTPITSIKVLADSLNTQEDVPVELYREFMTDIVHEIDRENQIINDLLALVKMDKKGENLQIESVDMNNLIESIFKRLSPLAKQGKVDLIFESRRSVSAEIDNVKMTLAITNLIENGIKYNHEEGFVKVILDADYQSCIITVSDSGIGIPEEDCKHIFERFYRVDKSHSREIGGTGLGLAITRNAVLMHRGTIDVESVPGEGTEFTMTVPLIHISSTSKDNKGENDEPSKE